MLELICQQRYRVSGVPVDLTPFRNHGTVIGTTSAAGPTGPDAAIAFNAPNSAVRIGLGTLHAWQPLTALKIEVDVHVPDPTAARTLCLVEGDSAFRFDIFEHAIEATVFTGGSQPTYLRAADAFAPDHGFHPVPVNRWVTLGLYHDGFARIQLTMDGRVVAEALVNGSVAGVGPGGVAIGNLLGGGSPLRGAISEVRIWRLDPNVMRREFLCRKIDAETARCLAAGFEDVWAWIAAHPEQAAALVAMVERQADEHSRAMLLQPAQERAREALAQIVKLWCKDKIDGKRMYKAQRAWLKSLKRAGLPDTGKQDDAKIRDILGSVAMPTISIDCDPALQAYIAVMADALDAGRRKKA